MKNGPVCQPHHPGHLIVGLGRVHLDFRFVARIHHNADDVLRVPQRHAPQQNVIIGERDLEIELFTILFELYVVDGLDRFGSPERIHILHFGIHSAIELIDQVIGPIKCQLGVKTADRLMRVLK